MKFATEYGSLNLKENSLKLYTEREAKVCKLTVLAEQAPVHVPLQTADAPGCPRDKLDDLLEEFSDVLSNEPGRTSVVTMDIQTETEMPICLPPYRVPDILADKVELAVKNLMEEGIIVSSTAAWSSPIVPVVKPSGLR